MARLERGWRACGHCTLWPLVSLFADPSSADELMTTALNVLALMTGDVQAMEAMSLSGGLIPLIKVLKSSDDAAAQAQALSILARMASEPRNRDQIRAAGGVPHRCLPWQPGAA